MTFAQALPLIEQFGGRIGHRKTVYHSPARLEKAVFAAFDSV